MAYKIGIVGIGKIARDQHLPVVAKSPDFELAAVVSSRSGDHGVPSFRTTGELLRSGVKLDAVSLCMPPGPRFDIARACLDAGLPVLLEKPPTPTMGELMALIGHATARKGILFTTWHSQYNAAVDQAKRILAGKFVRKLRVEWKEDVRHWHPGQDWIWEPGGFGVFDPTINAFSIVTKILPSPIFVSESIMEFPRNRATPIAGQIRFKPSAGGEADMSASLDWRQTGEQTWNITVETDDGMTLLLRKGGTELLVDGAPLVAEPSEEYEAIYLYFAELLKSRQSHIDVAPLQLVSDCFMLGRRVETEEFT